MPFIFDLGYWFRSWQPPLTGITTVSRRRKEALQRWWPKELCSNTQEAFPEVSQKQPGGEGEKEDGTPAVLNRAEPKKYDLGKSMILFILLGWGGLGRHWLRLMASFIIPHCSIKFYSLHLQSKSLHITLSAFFDLCD